ncbi:ATP-binding protein [Streptomyces sp. NPDC088812]|uniref:ATP-binding protein n=1 Tax=Streptomyces sp. NPDC088812 TaxID=3365905 RepID=UPI003809DE7A
MPLPQQRRFPRSHASVRDARAFVHQVLVEWDRTDRLDDIKLCASELATNALLHGVPPGREYRVTLELDGTVMRLGVRDTGSPFVALQASDTLACSGRGLHLIRQPADDMGVTEHVIGKTVWAAFRTDRRPGTP